jgi:hypothetical protein
MVMSYEETNMCTHMQTISFTDISTTQAIHINIITNSMEQGPWEAKSMLS